MKYACPACGDPNAYPLWIDGEPPDACPNEPERKSGICAYQRGKAEQRAGWMKQFPDQFDATGNMRPGGLAYILEHTPQGTVVYL